MFQHVYCLCSLYIVATILLCRTILNIVVLGSCSLNQPNWHKRLISSTRRRKNIDQEITEQSNAWVLYERDQLKNIFGLYCHFFQLIIFAKQQFFENEAICFYMTERAEFKKEVYVYCTCICIFAILTKSFNFFVTCTSHMLVASWGFDKDFREKF